jgi:glutamate-ammonia-ligase adenylyltransferase
MTVKDSPHERPGTEPPRPADVAVEEVTAALATHAGALLSHVRKDPSILADVLARPLDLPDDEASFRAAFRTATRDLEDGDELRRVLRRLRHRAVVRIALREVLRLADVDQTSAEMAWLAGAAIDAALDACARTVTRRHGEPIDEATNAPVPLVVLGMGKLGGGELNLGSDVDVCFFYGTDDAVVRGSELSVHELFTRVASRTAKALADVTEDGFVFRVDLRLRPEGSRGALASSLASAERYYETYGRAWERAVLLRARPVAGDLAFGAELLATLTPFVFRRAIDPAIARTMSEMLERSRRELHVDETRDVKLGKGGIREAEFFVQTLQLVWGGRHPELRVPGTVEAARRLLALGLITERESRTLEADWALLRRVEHRIHVQAGYQTHAIPPAGEERQRFARSLGFEDDAGFTRALDDARARIADLFASLTEEAPARDAAIAELARKVAEGATASELAEDAERALHVYDPDAAAAHLVRLGRRPGAPLGPLTLKELPELGPLLLAEVASSADPDEALRHLADLFARLGGHWGYDRLLVDDPRLARRLVGLFGSSATLAEALVRHPDGIDDLLLRRTAPTPDEIRAAHASLLVPDEREPADGDPEEAFVARLRHARLEVTLAVGLVLVSGELSEVEAEERLTVLAEAQIGAALAYATREAEARFGRPRPMHDGAPNGLVVVGLGKLGAGELGFGGDLDLAFLFGEDGEVDAPPGGKSVTAAELFTRVAQRTMRLLSQPSAFGRGYETDTRLRPSGSQGLLVVSLAAFDQYHATRAAAWERQALLRARPVAGEPSLGERVRARLSEIAYGGEPPERAEVARIRARMETELARERPGRYHAKLGYGGLTDIEFVVQWLTMQHGDDPRLRVAATRPALEALVRTGLLTPSDGEALILGHQFFRGVGQALRLSDESAELVVYEGGRVAEQVARRLGLRDRDGERASDVLISTWKRRARAVREVFERVIASVGTVPGWEAAA